MCDKRIRFNSALTYDEYMHFNHPLPKTPQIKPLDEETFFIPDLDLANDVSLTEITLSSPMKFEDETSNHQQIMKTKKHIKKRQRFFSESSQFSVISTLERQLKRKQSQNQIL